MSNNTKITPRPPPPMFYPPRPPKRNIFFDEIELYHGKQEQLPKLIIKRTTKF